jgi:copper chaperone
MKTVKYKTTIHCGGCLKSVTPFLNALDNVDAWTVNLDDPDKVLAVDLEDDNEYLIVEAVKKAGFEIEGVEE